MIFSIKQYSTLPILKLKLIKDGRNDFNRFYSQLENAAITFAMKEISTGRLQVVNEPGQLLLKDGCDEAGEKEFYISYTFTKEDTDTSGQFIGEFKLTFLDNMSELYVPIAEELKIIVLPSFVRSEVE